MLLYLKENGTLEVYSTENINQGSISANRLDILSTLDASGTVAIGFVLPNGQKTTFQVTTPTGISDSGYNLWSFTMTAALTQYAGTMQVQVLYTISGTTLASTLASFEIKRGTAALITSASPNDWNTLLSIYQQCLANMLASEGFSVGEQRGIVVTDGPYYQNNAKYFSEAAGAEKTGAEQAKTAAQDARDEAEAARDEAQTAAEQAKAYNDQSGVLYQKKQDKEPISGVPLITSQNKINSAYIPDELLGQ